MNAKKYTRPYDFRKALDIRLKQRASAEGFSLDQERKRVTFDRFLARLDFDRYLLKGGYSLELRLPQSVRTLDIDLAIRSKEFINTDSGAQQKAIFDDLAKLIEIDKSDFFEFKLERTMRSLPDLDEGGFRFFVTAKIDSRNYQQFHVDVAIETNIILPPEHLHSSDVLSFAGIETVDISAVTKEEVFAQKIHAYVRPRQNENSRVKDLIDMAALIEAGLNKEKVKKAIILTFQNSNTYKIVPNSLQSPPNSWEKSFSKVASERGLEISFDQAYERVAVFYKNLDISKDKPK